MAERLFSGLAFSLTGNQTLFDLKRQCSSIDGVSERDVVLRYKGREIQDQDLFGEAVGLKPGNYFGIPLEQFKGRNARAIVKSENVHTNDDGYVDSLKISSHSKDNPDIELKTVTLYSDNYQTDASISYAGFLLYGWRDHCNKDKIETSWSLGGKFCDTGFMFIGNTSLPKYTRYMGNKDYPPTGQVHGAVYWGVFGESKELKVLYEDTYGGDKKYDPGQAIGEGFSYNYKEPNGFTEASGTFNANTSDTYHDEDREAMADVTRECAKKVVDDWKKKGSSIKERESYELKDLKIKIASSCCCSCMLV